MPLVGTKEMFKKAYEGGYAIGAFNVNNMEIVQGITEAAAELNSPVILQASALFRKDSVFHIGKQKWMIFFEKWATLRVIARRYDEAI